MRVGGVALGFDANGTLHNDPDLIVSSIRYAFVQLGRKPPSGEEILRMMAIRKGLWSRPGISDKKLKKVHDIFNDHYIAHIDEVELFPDVIPTLEKLRRRNIPLFLITGQPKKPAYWLIQKRGLEKYFQEIVTSAKIKDPIFRSIVRRHNLNSATTYYVGDMPSDCEFANTAGIKSVWIKRGHVKIKWMRDTGIKPAHIIDRLSDLVKILSLERD